MLNSMLILSGKLISKVSKTLNLGNGSTWPGHIALKINKNFIKEMLQDSQTKIILVAGTNGKTTTSKMLATILQENKKRVFQNISGANLINGIASTLILNTNIFGRLKKEYGVFEIDENSLPFILKEVTPYAVILLNLFRDQLDRYGEIDSIAKKWKTALEELPPETEILLNADDPQIAYLGTTFDKQRTSNRSNVPTLLHYSTSPRGFKSNSSARDTVSNQGRNPDPACIDQAGSDLQSLPKRLELSEDQGTNIHFFGLDEKTTKNKLQHASDSIYCPHCHTKLIYKNIYYSHLGNWQCPNCKLARPKPDITLFFYPLAGTYNKYNTLAAVMLAKLEHIDDKNIEKALKQIQPAFGRQEIVEVDGKKAQLFLAKNPASFNQSLATIQELGAKHVLFVLNDRIPDGRDVSWIWDIDIEDYLPKFDTVTVSGDRVYDMGLRVEYAEKIQNSKGKNQNLNSKVKMFENLDTSIRESLSLLKPNEMLYILPTYSAMLEVRKILTGKKIL